MEISYHHHDHSFILQNFRITLKLSEYLAKSLTKFCGSSWAASARGSGSALFRRCPSASRARWKPPWQRKASIPWCGRSNGWRSWPWKLVWKEGIWNLMSLGEVQFGDFRNLFHESLCIRHTSKDWTSKWVCSPPFFGRPFKGNCCLFFSAVFFDQTVGMAVACSNQGESNWFRDHRSLAEKPRCQVAWTGERWVDEWMSGWMDEVFMAFFPWWTTELQRCLYINGDGVDYRGSTCHTCHPITSEEDFGDTEIHTPKTILEYVWIPQYPRTSLNLNSPITFLRAGPNSIILSV